MPTRRKNPLSFSMAGLLCGLNDPRNCAHHALELRDLHDELLASCRRELVVAGAAIAGGGAPSRDDPALDEHALQRRIERPFFDLQYIFGGLLDRVGDLKAMQLAIAGERLQDEEIEGSRWDIVTILSHVQGAPGAGIV